MSDELEYLQPSFDPSSVTVPKLRNILMTHDIRYPASAKKPELIDVFNMELRPRARKLLAARDRVRRTSQGITYVPSSQEDSVDDESEGRTSMPPPPIPNTPKRRKSRKSVRAASEDRIDEEPTAKSGATGQRSSSKRSQSSDPESEPNANWSHSGRPRKRASSPSASQKPIKETLQRPPLGESAFSDDNPFQSGSSPLAPEADRRKTTGSSSKSKPRTPTDRRKTDGATLTSAARDSAAGAKVSTTHSVGIPVSSLKQGRVKSPPQAELEPGEEFTPEEQQELLKEEQNVVRADGSTRRIKMSTGKSGNVPKSFPWVVLTALLGGYATWYRQEKLAVGYCGIGHPSDAISSIEIPEWADVLRPTCELCPQHAICYENLETKCEEGFLLQYHPLSLGGIVPIPPSCEPDDEKARKIKNVADRAVEKLRERNAAAECGTLVDSTGKIETSDLPESKLKEVVAKQKRKGMSEAEFEDLWKGAIGEVMGREDIVQVGQSPDGLRLASTSIALLPFTCSLKRSARLTLARYRVPISLIVAFLTLVAYIRQQILRSRADAARVPDLVKSTLDRLATQAAMYSRGDALESWTSVGQLRDDVLRDEFSDTRREKIWKRVQTIVERNANVRASSRELSGGDVSRVWEWVGSLGLLEDPGFSGRKSGGSKRVSWGGAEEQGDAGQRRSSPLNDEMRLPGDGELVEQRRWDEGRPIY